MFELKRFFHNANLVQIKSGLKVEKDPNAAPSKGLTAIYTGKSSSFSIVIAKGLKGSNDKTTVNIFESKEGKKLTVIDHTRYVLTKEFASVSFEKKSGPSYILMIFEDQGKKFYFEMFNNGKNTLTIDPINLSIKTEEIKKNFKIGLNYDF